VRVRPGSCSRSVDWQLNQTVIPLTLTLMTSLRSIRSWTLIGLLAAATLRCGGDTMEPPPTATTLAAVSGDGQTGVIGQALANPLVVKVTDASGNPVSGVGVQWAVQGDGSVSSATVTTGSDGLASVQRILGSSPGDETTTATVSGLQGSPVTFTSTAAAGSTGSIVITTNPPVSALDGEVFDPSVQPVLQVKDASGNPAVGVEVTAAITSGGGTLDGTTTATSDASGIARFGDLGISGTGSHTLEFTAGDNSVTSSPVDVSALPSEATTGKWGPVVPWDIVPLHMSLLPTGKIIAWGKFEDGGAMGTMADRPRLWDPAEGPPTTARQVQADTMLFCSGHTQMPDGRLMVSGGHKADDTGINVTNIFDPQTESWETGLPNMAHGRWYPTVTTLPDGRILTMAGRDEAGKVVTTPEIWVNNQWVELTGAGSFNVPYYPRNFVPPSGPPGRIFMAGERVQSQWFDVDANNGQGQWTTNGPTHVWKFNRDYGTAVMYEAGKILYAGGGGNSTWGQTPDPRDNAPTATAERIDLNDASPTWTSAGSMAFPRRHLNSTILPDGTVLITGGTTGGGFVDINEAHAAKAAELWDPKSPTTWKTLAAASKMRVYHSVALLLPDATVLAGASGDAFAGPVEVPPERNHEIFSPPYLFKGARPTITGMPSDVTWGQTFTVTTPNAAQITEVRWIHIGSVTHAFDMGQRANKLTFTRTGTGVDVTAPGSAQLAPPGPYLVFILNRNGVPSVGKFIRVH
jgi:hypothetical protein